MQDRKKTEAQLIAELETLRQQILEMEDVQNERQSPTAVEASASERRPEAERLPEGQLYIASIIDIANESIISIDETQHIISFNQGAEKIFGYSAGEVIGQPLDILLPDRFVAIHRRYIDDFAESAASTRLMEERQEICGRRKNGVEFPAEASISQLEVAGQRIFTVVLRDVSEHKQAEAALRKAHAELERRVEERTAELTEAITVLEEQISERKRAEAAEKLHKEALRQYAARLGVLHEIDQAILSTRSPATIAQATLGHIRRLAPCQRASVVVFDFEAGETVILAADVNGETHLGRKECLSLDAFGSIPALRQGQPRIVTDILALARPSGLEKQLLAEGVRSYIAVPLFFRDELIGTLNVSATDLGVLNTESVEILREVADELAIAIMQARLYEDLQERMEALQETQAQLIHSEKMAALGRLVASIAHEINNPLQSVQSCLTLTREELEDGQRPEKLDRYVGIVESEIDRISAIVGRMRDFYLPMRQEWRPTDLHPVLGSVLDLAGKQLQHSHISVERVWSDDLPPVQANAGQLKQVFLNLILNAIDAMPRGGRLRISTGLDRMAGGNGLQAWPALRLEFNDTGAGMSAETLSHLFEPFFTTKPGGSGLGLSISHGIIETHQGRITVTSQMGLGTTFTILLPVAQP